MKHLTEEQAQRQIEELQAHIESVRAAKKKEHFPQDDDGYRAPHLNCMLVYQSDDTDYFCTFTTAAHRDKASADKHIEIIRYMVDLAREEEPLDWGDGRMKYYIGWGFNEGYASIDFITDYQIQGTFYLPSDAACQKVIDKFGDDLRVLFGMSLKEG